MNIIGVISSPKTLKEKGLDHELGSKRILFQRNIVHK